MDAAANLVLSLGNRYINYACDVKLLESKLRSLLCRAVDIKEQVENNESSGKKKRKREVENWFKDVKEVKDEFIALKNSVNKDGLWRHPLSGDEVVKMQERVAELHGQSQHFDGFVREAFENRGEPRLTGRLFGDMSEDNLKEICQCLLSDDIRSIGIYGMGGVGKTTLAKHIHNHLLKIPDRRVCWLTVSQELSIRKLQDDIARNLSLPLSNNDDEETRAAILSRKLMKMKNFILILDDVWQGFCLKKLGNPLSARCRLILTTRSLELCRKMQCQRTFQVKTLRGNEAWELFKDTLGYQTRLQPDVEEVARMIVERCGGLPLGIITMAGSMRRVEDLHEWRNALEQLKALSVGLDDMESDVFPILKWSFDRLNKCQQRCLLCCSLYPEDHFISRVEIISKFISFDLMDRRDTRKQEYDQGHVILDKLINVCLLEKVIDHKKVDCVKMHDLIRDMALRIASGKLEGDMPRYMVKSGVGLKELPSQREWEEDVDVVSLMYNDIFEISPRTSPRCPNLSVLILEHNYLEAISDSFFAAFMNKLKVLDLSHTEIQELPNCISDMVNLTALILKGCRSLKLLPPLGRLKNLKELDLWRTSIDNIPQGIEELVSLKYLNMVKVDEAFQQIPEGTFSRLCYLQYLRIPCAIEIKELEAMKQLEIFEGSLFDLDSYNKLARSHLVRGGFDKFRINVGVPEEDDFMEDSEIGLDCNTLSFENCNFGNTGREGVDVVLLPQNIETLKVNGCYGMGSCLAETIQLNGLNSLSKLAVAGPGKVESLFRLSTLGDHIPNCSRLRIIGLQELVELVRQEDLGAFRNDLTHGTFSCLQEFRICHCDKITKLFPIWLLQNLQNLKKVVVEYCSNLEEIFVACDDDARGRPSHILPKLQRLELRCLPQLRSIYNGTLSCESLQIITIFLCPNLKRLPVNGEVSCPRALERIIGSDKWWDSLKWDNPSAKDDFLKCLLRTTPVVFMS